MTSEHLWKSREGVQKSKPDPVLDFERWVVIKPCAMPKVAILDDYQGVALQMADWSVLPPDCRVQVFRVLSCSR